MDRVLQKTKKIALVAHDNKKLDLMEWAKFNRDLLAELPAGVDPCGERGEFHTFVTAGPMLREPVGVAPGEIVEREGFVYADLIPS